MSIPVLIQSNLYLQLNALGGDGGGPINAHIVNAVAGLTNSGSTLFQVQNGGVVAVSVDRHGNLIGAGLGGAWQLSSANELILNTALNDAGGPVIGAITFNNVPALTNAGSTLVEFRNGGTAQLAVDLYGNLKAAALDDYAWVLTSANHLRVYTGVDDSGGASQCAFTITNQPVFTNPISTIFELVNGSLPVLTIDLLGNFFHYDTGIWKFESDQGFEYDTFFNVVGDAINTLAVWQNQNSPVISILNKNDGSNGIQFGNSPIIVSSSTGMLHTSGAGPFTFQTFNSTVGPFFKSTTWVNNSDTLLSVVTDNSGHFGIEFSDGTFMFTAGAGGPVTSIGAFGGSDANGLTIHTPGILNLDAADGTHPGGVSTGAQNFGGNKTFFDGITLAAPGISTLNSGATLDVSAGTFKVGRAFLAPGTSGTANTQSGRFNLQTGSTYTLSNSLVTSNTFVFCACATTGAPAFLSYAATTGQIVFTMAGSATFASYAWFILNA